MSQVCLLESNLNKVRKKLSQLFLVLKEVFKINVNKMARVSQIMVNWIGLIMLDNCYTYNICVHGQFSFKNSVIFFVLHVNSALICLELLCFMLLDNLNTTHWLTNSCRKNDRQQLSMITEKCKKKQTIKETGVVKDRVYSLQQQFDHFS